MVKCDFSINMMQTKFRLLIFFFSWIMCFVQLLFFAFSMLKMYLCIVASGGFKVGGARGKTKKGPSDDVIIISQPW